MSFWDVHAKTIISKIKFESAEIELNPKESNRAALGYIDNGFGFSYIHVGIVSVGLKISTRFEQFPGNRNKLRRLQHLYIILIYTYYYRISTQ